MTTPMIVMSVILGVFLLYAVVSPVVLNILRFLGRTRLFCPVHHVMGAMHLNALGAAFTAGYGAPVLHVRDCSLLRPGQKCEEGCLKDADL